MTDHESLLIELGTEELPPKSLDALAAAFARGVCDGLVKREIAAAVDGARVYCSPRRLAVLVPAVAASQPDQTLERRGPAVNAALDASGEPTRALAGFARSCGIEISQLEKLETDKGAWFVHRARHKGRTTAQLIPEILDEALRALPIPKPMRWGDHDYSFVRPAHWLVILHGADVIDVELLGQKSGRQSRGHRFHHPSPVHVADAESWLDALRMAKVLADPAERRARIRTEVERAHAGQVGNPRLTDLLLNEIANLTEWPVAIACGFDPAFLAVPPEALVTTMEANQKFVPVFDANNALRANFVGVANIESSVPDTIRNGYQRVIRPRFADAKFFWDEDRKQPLASHQEALKSVTYQQALGSMWDKCLRVIELSRTIANRLRDQGVEVDTAQVVRAAQLSKCDLLTRMVGEFPELQGIMGRHYAAAEGESAGIARALDEFYRPRFAGDGIAAGKIGQVLAVAERLDTLAGIFAVGMKPSGNKDPFALRRAALGLARTLIEGNLQLDLRAQLIEAAQLVLRALESVKARGLKAAIDEAKKKGVDALRASTAYWARDEEQLALEVHEFVVDRLRGYYADHDICGEAFDAVRAMAPSDLTDFDRRLRAVVAFAQLPEAAALAAANKRIGNLLRQADENADRAASDRVDEALFEAGAERDLSGALADAEVDVAPLIATDDYLGVLKRLARLREPVDAYFDGVMVMVDDAGLRRNRLAMLRRLQDLFLRVADIGRLAAS
ncbi:MAG: glycine--tRNA ligase subunit beta [Rhodanobacteraceae bacterium]